MKALRLSFFLVGILLLSGCTSYFKRKQCESTNWFEHGKNIALKGEWVSADSFVNECRKVEANIDESKLDQGFKNGMERYCNNANAYSLGKVGDAFSRDLCEGPGINSMLKEHTRGINDYCKKENGYNAGASGKKYRNVCTSEQEQSFFPEYKRGRKKYVQTQIDDLIARNKELDTQIQMKTMELHYKQLELDTADREVSRLESDRRYMMNSNPGQLSYIDGQLSSAQGRASRARSDVYSIKNQVDGFTNSKSTNDSKLSEYRSELPGLE